MLFVSWGSTCIEILEDKLFAHWLDDRPHQCTDVTDESKSNKSLSQTMHSSHIWPMGLFWNIEATPTLIGRRNSGIYHFLPWILEQTKVKLWKSYPSLPSRSLDLWETRSPCSGFRAVAHWVPARFSVYVNETTVVDVQQHFGKSLAILTVWTTFSICEKCALRCVCETHSDWALFLLDIKGA